MIAHLSTSPGATDGFLRRVAPAYAIALLAVIAAWSPIYPDIEQDTSWRIVDSAAELRAGDEPVLWSPTIDVKGDLAYHYLNAGLPYALIHADPAMPLRLREQAGWHEVAEMRVDRLINRYDDDGFAVEVCDALQTDEVLQPVDEGDPVLLSPIALPGWFRWTHATTGKCLACVAGVRRDSAGLLTDQHQLRPGGYAMRKGVDGKIAEVYGERWPGHAASKEGPHSRRARRSGG